jgi:hypothetical protein
MPSLTKIRVFFLTLAGFVLIAATGFIIATCKAPTEQFDGLVDSPLNSLVKNTFGKGYKNSEVTGNLQRMRDVVNATRKKTGLSWTNVDAYIILVNDVDIMTYTFAYGNEAGYRNEQPVHSVIIKAPANFTAGTSYFHSLVKTDAIAHELGHAMARLQDEYDYVTAWPGRPELLRDYASKFRNISEWVNGKLKWQGLIDLDIRYLSSTPFQAPSATNDQKLGYYTNPQFYIPGTGTLKKYYIPTVNSTMRGENVSNNYQFGPVNTYHLEGSFKTRLGEIPAQDPVCIVDGLFYEWLMYPFSEFIKDKKWAPDKGAFN